MASPRKHQENSHEKTTTEKTPTDAVDTGPAGSGVVSGPGETSGQSHQGSGGTSAETLVNSDTGEISGAGFEQQKAPEVLEVDMPKRIVAKDIVGRAALKCTKKTVPVLDEKGEPKKDGDGSIITTVEVSPPRDLYMVFGAADGTRSGTSQYGDWVCFTGNFEARRCSDGKVFRSNECILQSPADRLLLDALTSVKKRDSGASVNFAFTVGVRTSQRWVDTNEGNSYEYTIRSQINVEQHDPLAHLRQSLKGVLPAPPQKQLTGPA